MEPGGDHCISVMVMACPWALWEDTGLVEPCSPLRSGFQAQERLCKAKGQRRLGGCSILKETLPLPGDMDWGGRGGGKRKRRRRQKPLSG